MKKIVDWISTHKLLTFCLALLLMIAQPIFVHWMFKTKAISPFWEQTEQTWSAGDLLTYIAGFEAFLGTVFLGAVAVRQNDKAQELNKRMLANEEKHRKFERRPCIQVSPKEVTIKNINSVFSNNGPVYYYKGPDELDDYPSKYWDKEYLFFSWDIKNVTSKQIRISLEKLDLEVRTQQEKLSFSEKQINLSPPLPYIAPLESIGIGFILDMETMQARNPHQGELELEIINDVNEKYRLNLTFAIIPTNQTTFFLYTLFEQLAPVESQ